MIGGRGRTGRVGFISAPRPSGDVAGLTEHFARLSYPSRYNRFMGAVSNYSKIAFDCLVPNRTADPLTLIAEVRHEAREMVVGEAIYAVEGRTGFGEFAISVCGGWQNRALGSALLSAFAIARRQPGVFWPVRRNVQDERSGEGAGAESRLRSRAIGRLAGDTIRKAAA